MSSSQGSSAAQGTTALRSDAQHSAVPPLPEGKLYPRGFRPMWTEARDVEQAIYGLSYILQQIQATDTYRPNIGQISAAMSSLEFAIRALAQQAPTPASAEGTEAAQVAGESSREDH